MELIVRWHAVPVTHVATDGSGCGKEASVLEILVSSDGCICISGLCMHCGETFTSPAVNWWAMMQIATVKDYLQAEIPAEPRNVVLCKEPKMKQ